MDFNILYPIAWGWNSYNIKLKFEASKTTLQKRTRQIYSIISSLI